MHDFDTLTWDDLTALARYRAVPFDPDAGDTPIDRARIITALIGLPDPVRQRSKFAGKRVVRAHKWRLGGNPRRLGSHGHNAYNLIPLGDFGIKAEDLLGRIRRLPPKSSERYGAGGANHLQWDLDHGFTLLIDDPGPPIPGEWLPDDPSVQLPPPSRLAIDVSPPQRVQIQVTRVVRDTEVVRWLKRLYNNSCQICGAALKGEGDFTYSEGHHLRPLGTPHSGPDCAANILIVCPNHHALCDFGAILLALEDLVVKTEHGLGSAYVDYHNDVVFRHGRSA